MCTVTFLIQNAYFHTPPKWVYLKNQSGNQLIESLVEGKDKTYLYLLLNEISWKSVPLLAATNQTLSVWTSWQYNTFIQQNSK